MYRPKVSIVIPAYNAENYLAEAVDSALAQTYDNVEVIVVNDGSPDDGATARVAAKYGDKIKYFEKPNGGSSSALNCGIENMTGEWFSWLSHDDLYYPEKIADEIEYLNNLDVDFSNENELQKHIIFASADIIDGNGKMVKKVTEKELAATSEKINNKESSLRLIAEPTQDGFHGCTCLVHKKAFENQGIFDEKLRLLNDMDMWYRFYIKDYKIHFIPKALVKGRVHAKQVSRSIGFSYHNPEQDMFWNRSLNWLKSNHPDRYDLFYIFGKTALKKTRFVEGKLAFKKACEIDKRKRLSLWFKKIYFISYANMRSLAKKIYLAIKA